MEDAEGLIGKIIAAGSQGPSLTGVTKADSGAAGEEQPECTNKREMPVRSNWNGQTNKCKTKKEDSGASKKENGLIII
jgi:hypothetical protein